MAIPTVRMRQLLVPAIILAMMAGGARPAAQSAPSAHSSASQEAVTPLQPPLAGVSGDQILAELVKHNELRNAELRQYSAIRTYAVKNTQGKTHAQKIVQMDYRAPGTKIFVTTSEEGSRLVRLMVLNRLIDSETETAAGKERRDSSITPANYTFDLLGEEQLGPYYCYVVQSIPIRKDKYLFEGKVWIDALDFAIVKIAGHPAKKLSFWIDRAEFVRQYQKVGEFWLPLKDETLVDVRIYGKKILTIDHRVQTVNEAKTATEQEHSSYSFSDSIAPTPE
jgi:hypothetical protein